MLLRTMDVPYVHSVVDRAQTCIRPLKNAEMLLAKAFACERFWQFEKQDRSLCTSGCAWGHVNEVPKVGDYLPLTVMMSTLNPVKHTNVPESGKANQCSHEQVELL